MTSVVFPDAQLKIYLDASVEIRAKRRFQQEYSTLSLDEIQKAFKIEMRSIEQSRWVHCRLYQRLGISTRRTNH